MPGAEKFGRFLLLLAGMLMTIPSTTSAQAEPATPDPVSGRALSITGVIPADVLARVELLGSELELIRFEMGQPKAPRTEMVVTHAVPREVLFQAATLFRKANQLTFELTDDPGPELLMEVPTRVRPLHVWKVVDAAYKRILVAKRALGITEQLEEELPDPAVLPSEVLRALIQTSRQLSLLLQQPPATSDVYQQVVLATYFAAGLLERFPEATGFPATPAFERGKRPVDVYKRLVECYARISRIADRSGVEVLKLKVPTREGGIDEAGELTPSEVYDFASLIVAELIYLQAQLEDSELPTPPYNTSLKLPAHVYQQAGVLLLQLAELETRVETDPEWLTR